MPRATSAFGMVLKWLGAPLGCAALGYFVVAPRLVHKAPAASKPVPTVVAKAEPPVEMPPETSVEPPLTKKKRNKPPVIDPPELKVEEQPAKTTKVDPNEKPVLEVTTDQPRKLAPPKVSHKRARKRKPKKVAQPTTTGQADPASNAAPPPAETPAPKPADDPNNPPE